MGQNGPMSAVRWHRSPDLDRPVAVMAFAGWGDAGDASTGAVAHLVSALEGEVIAEIDPDGYYEFQARRPEVTLDREGRRSIVWPANTFFAVSRPGRHLLALAGEEPHLHWRAFCREVSEVLGAVGAERIVLLGAFLGQVAHSRPVPLVGAGANPAHLLGHGIGVSGYEGPTGIVGVLTQHLIESGRDALSIWAAVPHYLANQPYPPAMHALAAKVSEVLDLGLDVEGLATEADEFRSNVDEAVAGNQELSEYVAKLAELTDGEDQLPSEDPVEGLVEEIERFLEDR
jgi:predicted ATP-grasp superfamily ATP-dependent carboligase